MWWRVWQIGNEMDSHCWHLLGLKTVKLRITCVQRRLLFAWVRIFSRMKARTDAPWPHAQRGKDKFSSVRRPQLPRSTNFPAFCPGTLPWWLRVDWLSCKTLQAMSRMLKQGRLQRCRLPMNSAVCPMLLPHCSLRTAKGHFGSFCWSWGASKHESVVSNSNAGREGRWWGSSAGGVRKV